MRRAVTLLTTTRGRRWAAFEDPLEVHRARELSEVVSLLRRVEEATHAGRWVVLVLAYDAGPALEPAMDALRHPTAPLAVAGVFRGPAEVAGPRLAEHRVGAAEPSWGEAEHHRAVRSLLDHIGRGDVYQANLTLRLRAPFEGDPEGLFTRLVRNQGPGHATFVDLGDHAVCSASPELLLRRDGRRLWTRPMKGTRRRVPGTEAERVAELRASVKDRAENTMIVDVARNDLGRIAETGTVVVERLHAVEHYPTVHQMVSSVTARTDAGLEDVLRAVFPAASVTGAPKIRATQLIARHEIEPRGVYCGAVGVLGPGQRWELNVAIRTAWVDRREGTVEYGVGGGIVSDSDPAAEWTEAMDKAAVLGRDEPGYELLETMRAEAGRIAAAERHAARLAASAAFLGFDLDGVRAREAVESAAEAARGVGRARVRLLVDHSGGTRVEVTPAPPAGTRECPQGPVRAALARHPVRPDDPFVAHKTTMRAVHDLARAGRPEAVEVVLWNEAGRLTETTTGNLVLELEGRLVTPRAGLGLLAGTARAALLEAGEVEEAEPVVADLRRATRAWSVNAVRGWTLLDLRPAGSCDGHQDGGAR